MRLIPCLLFALLLAAPGAAAQPSTPADAERLRTQSLALVNAARTARGRAPLALADSLVEAAAAHARDMAARGYYAHVSPDGATARDRFLAAGGAAGRVVRENIARCTGCPLPPGPAAVEDLHAGWMESPGHRANILAEGLSDYGFAIAWNDAGRRYAVETFAGPGTAPAQPGAGPPQPLDPAAQTAHAVARINALRGDAPPLSAAPALVAHAAAVLPAGDLAGVALDDLAPLSGLPADLPWRRYEVLFARCGGCGTTATDADVDHFLDRWRDGAGGTLTRAGLTAIGLAIAADGGGSKIALAILAGD
ncbi:CAP domain-containing protein [Aquibium sp. A9E412]|uniref:CAP domain-containing protein n=1 Tax=Aquibium sp. A9E412 TaxID=2976767 RepID=UPI0025B03F0E|nr:CAP domain-containing protein [Aquibium sp. A9E412]MDN2568535.1 CAP domain-containing protein [Aquibium sp. A9E412]